jgi:hypothetical protein
MEKIKQTLEQWGQVFSALPLLIKLKKRISAIFVVFLKAPKARV